MIQGGDITLGNGMGGKSSMFQLKIKIKIEEQVYAN